MALKFIKTTLNSDSANFIFEGDMDVLKKTVNDFFIAQKYKLKSGSLENAVYERGNYVARILLGAFIAYYKFNIVIKPTDEGKLMVYLVKGHSGFSGGLIGIAKLKKEFKRIAEGLEKIDSPLGAFTTT